MVFGNPYIIDIRFYPCDIHVINPPMIQVLRYCSFFWTILSVMYNFSNHLAILYTQSRPIMLSLRCLAATAGTSLVRNSQTRIYHHLILWWNFTVIPSYSSSRNASSNVYSLTKIPHCCRWWDCFKSQVTGRPLRPVKDHWLDIFKYPILILYSCIKQLSIN